MIASLPVLRRPGRKARPVYSVCRQCRTYFRLKGTRPQKHCSRSCAKKAWWERGKVITVGSA